MMLRPQQGAPDVRGVARARRVGHRVPARLLTDARRRALRGAVRAGAGAHDRQGQPRRRVDAARHVGVPEGARPAAQPVVRPRIRLDRMRAMHAPAVRRRAGARRALGRALKWECGIHEAEAATRVTRHSGRSAQPGRAYATTQRASRASSISSRSMVAERVAVDLHRERPVRASPARARRRAE